MPVEYDRRGRDHFYRALDPWPGLVQAHAIAPKVVAKLRRVGTPEARAKQVLLSALMRDLERDTRLMESRVAAAGTKAVQRRIKATQKRPDGTRQLHDAVESRPMSAYPPVGAVGIADIDILDRKVMGRPHMGKGPSSGQQPYWHVQEDGSDHLVGKTIVGFFHPGFSRPNRMQFRQHSSFSTETGGGHSYGGAMTIKRPIEARHFLRDGAEDAAKFRFRESLKLTSSAVMKGRPILALGTRR